MEIHPFAFNVNSTLSPGDEFLVISAHFTFSQLPSAYQSVCLGGRKLEIFQTIVTHVSSLLLISQSVYFRTRLSVFLPNQLPNLCVHFHKPLNSLTLMTHPYCYSVVYSVHNIVGTLGMHSLTLGVMMITI